MTLVHASLLLGMLAAAIPIALHLTGRREPKRVVFGSLFFLTQRFEVNRTRLRLRRYWLLATRMLALAILAIALASPWIRSDTGWATRLALPGIALAVIGCVLASLFWIWQRKAVAMGMAIVAAVLGLLGGGLLLFSTDTDARAVTGGGPVAVAILIDNSPTSLHRDWDTGSAGTTASSTSAPASKRLLDRYLDQARQTIADLPRGSLVAVMDRSGLPPILESSRSAAIARLSGIQPTAVPKPIPSRLAVAATVLGSSPLQDRRLIVWTDLQAASWSDSTNGGESNKNELGDLPRDQVSEDPSSTSAEVPNRGEAAENDRSETSASASTESATAGTIDADVIWSGSFRGWNRRLVWSDGGPPQTVVRGTTPRIEVEVRRDMATSADSGSDAVPDSETKPSATVIETSVFDSDPSRPVIRNAAMVLPDTRVANRQAIAPESQTSRVLIDLPPVDSVALVQGYVQLEGVDAFAADDRLDFAATVRPPASIILACDDEDESFVIGQTLTAAVGSGWDARLDVTRVEVSDLASLDLQSVDAVIVLDPPAEAFATAALRRYLRDGGKAWIALGDRFDADEAKGWTASIRRVWRTGDAANFLVPVRTGSPMLRGLVGDAGWNRFPVHLYWQWTSDAKLEDNVDVRVPIRYSQSDHAAMLDLRFDDAGGRMLLLTTPVPALVGSNRDWNELFGEDAWPIWLLIRQSVDELLSGDATATNVIAGSPAVLPLPTDHAKSGKDTEPDDAPEDRPGDVSASSFDGSDPNVAGSPDANANDGGAANDRREPPVRNLTLYAPGRSTPVPIEARSESARVVVRQTSTPGNHWVRGSDFRGGFAVRYDAGQLERVQVSPDDLAASAWWSQSNFGAARVHRSIEGVDWSGSAAVADYSLVPWLMVGLFLAFLAEQWLSRPTNVPPEPVAAN